VRPEGREEGSAGGKVASVGKLRGSDRHAEAADTGVASRSQTHPPGNGSRSPRPIIVCPLCGQENDAVRDVCENCGDWFPPDAKVILRKRRRI
jgi:hypothetical protein